MSGCTEFQAAFFDQNKTTIHPQMQLNHEQKELVSLLNGRKELEGKNLSKAQELVYAGLYFCSKGYTDSVHETGGWFTQSNKQLLDLTGISSKKTLQTSLRVLIDLGLIERKKGTFHGRLASSYRMCTDKKCTDKSVPIDFEKCTDEERFNFLKERKLRKSVPIKCTDVSVPMETEKCTIDIDIELDKEKDIELEWTNTISDLKKRIEVLEEKVKELEEEKKQRATWNGVVDFDALFSIDQNKEEHHEQAPSTDGMDEPSSIEVELNDTPDGEMIDEPQTEVEKDNAAHEQETTHTSSQRLSIEDYINVNTSNEDAMNLLYPSNGIVPQEPSEKVQSNSKGTDLQGNIPSKPQNSPIQPTETKTSVTTHTSTKEAQNNQKNTLTMKTTNQTPANTLEWLESNTPGTSDERYLYLSKVFQALREPHNKQEHDLILSQARKGYINEGKYQEFLSKNPYREQTTRPPQGNDDYKTLFAAAKEAYQSIQTCKADELKTKMAEAKKAVDALETIYTNKEKWRCYKDEMYSKIDAAFRKRTENERYDKEEAINNQAYLRDIENATDFLTITQALGGIFTSTKCKRISPKIFYDYCKEAIEKNTIITDDVKKSALEDLEHRLSLAEKINNNQ